MKSSETLLWQWWIMYNLMSGRNKEVEILAEQRTMTIGKSCRVRTNKRESVVVVISSVESG